MATKADKNVAHAQKALEKAYVSKWKTEAKSHCASRVDSLNASYLKAVESSSQDLGRRERHDLRQELKMKEQEKHAKALYKAEVKLGEYMVGRADEEDVSRKANKAALAQCKVVGADKHADIIPKDARVKRHAWGHEDIRTSFENTIRIPGQDPGKVRMDYYGNVIQRDGRSLFHIDHMRSLARGGTNDPYNLTVTTPVINLQKHASVPDKPFLRRSTVIDPCIPQQVTLVSVDDTPFHIKTAKECASRMATRADGVNSTSQPVKPDGTIDYAKIFNL